jgi:hypothetical protein
MKGIISRDVLFHYYYFSNNQQKRIRKKCHLLWGAVIARNLNATGNISSHMESRLQQAAKLIRLGNRTDAAIGTRMTQKLISQATICVCVTCFSELLLGTSRPAVTFVDTRGTSCDK